VKTGKTILEKPDAIWITSGLVSGSPPASRIKDTPSPEASVKMASHSAALRSPVAAESPQPPFARA